MKRYTYRTKAHDLTATELIAQAIAAAGEGDWTLDCVEWYGDDKDQRATVELVAPDLAEAEF